MDIKLALAQLDPSNDDQWTNDGLPIINVVSELVGAKVTRKQITDAAPDFTREAAKAAQDAAFAEQQEEQAASLAAEAEPVVTELSDAEPTITQAEDAEPTAPVKRDIMRTPMTDILQSAELCQEAIDAVSGKLAELSKERKVLNEEIARWERQSNYLSNRLAQLHRRNPNAQMDPIKRYLATQKKVREERAAKAQAFVAAGTNAQDVAKALQTKSNLDMAMSRRKAPLGAGRPAPRAPQPQG